MSSNDRRRELKEIFSELTGRIKIFTVSGRYKQADKEST